MLMYNLIEYSDNYSDSSGCLWQFKRDELNVDVINTVLAKIMLLHLSKKPVLLVILVQMEEKNGIKIAAPLKYLSNFWRSLEIPLINCKVDHSLEWYTNCITIIGGNDATFVIRNTQLYVPVDTLKKKTMQNYQNY